jgi:hypothetical protein
LRGVILSGAVFQAERRICHPQSTEAEIPRPAGESAGLRSDATTYDLKLIPRTKHKRLTGSNREKYTRTIDQSPRKSVFSDELFRTTWSDGMKTNDTPQDAANQNRGTPLSQAQMAAMKQK